jgi:hypothetical protein
VTISLIKSENNNGPSTDPCITPDVTGKCLNLVCRLPNRVCEQGRTGHITRWEKSHGAPLDWGPLRQSGAPQHRDLFFVDQLNL